MAVAASNAKEIRLLLFFSSCFSEDGVMKSLVQNQRSASEPHKMKG
ncbi:hypothetical protein BN137_1099 [Cronobacter condimenti 1330]|uniref:Uncharacterized protein n=1 Tax=Cronobacter condimenti 1330 TaxID=1073999 RepID=K7ZYP2_9ENTR|nr:hypothetical protein BN137_1099 [Cronobacter condimenti 1330]